MLKILLEDQKDINNRINEIDIHIAEKWEPIQLARIIETIPRIGEDSYLPIASEIGNVNNFSGRIIHSHIQVGTKDIQVLIKGTQRTYHSKEHVP